MQDAVLAGNEELMRLCLAAYSSIPFTEVHVVTMTTHQMYNEGSSAQPSRKKHRDEANPTIAEYVERLRGPQYSTSVQRAAVHLLDKWAREMDNADKVEVITAGAAAQQTQQTGKQKKNNSKHVESTKPITFPKDRRMKMTEDVALPMNASDALEFKISNAQKSSVRSFLHMPCHAPASLLLVCCIQCSAYRLSSLHLSPAVRASNSDFLKLEAIHC